MKFSLLLLFLVFVVIRGESQEEAQCGAEAGGKLCPVGYCCSKWGHCGTTDAYCAADTCQYQCPISNIISKEQFDEMLFYRDTPRCPARGFYTYKAFIDAASLFPDFGNVGDNSTRLREIAAFLAQSSHTTSVRQLRSSPETPYAWGYCLKAKPSDFSHCIPDDRWPCAPGKKYYPRGPLGLAMNTLYGQIGEIIGEDLLSDPDLVVTDPVVSFKTAIALWMVTRSNAPSCHDVMIGKWEPSYVDLIAQRLPGYGLTTNVLTSGTECGRGVPNQDGEDRIGFYQRYCDILGIAYGHHLDCYNQWPFFNPSVGAAA